MKFLKNILINSINRWTRGKSLIKVFRYLTLASIIFTILKLIGFINWNWRIVIFPLYINCLLVEFLILSELITMLITQLADQIDDKNKKQNR